MKKNILILVIICLLLTYGLISVSALKPNKTTLNNEKQGNFNAKLGRHGSEISFVILEGKYKIQNRLIKLYGKVSTDDKEGRFRGILRGNHFIIQIPIASKIITILGRFNRNEDNSFQGVWIGRSLLVRGWISFTLTPKV